VVKCPSKRKVCKAHPTASPTTEALLVRCRRNNTNNNSRAWLKSKREEKSKYAPNSLPDYYSIDRDAQLLANRIALLKQEEMKTWKKIEETKKRTNDISGLKKRNEEKV